MLARHLPRLHRSSLVVAAVVLVCGFVANLGGDFHPDEQLGVGRISFGFPWAYGDWEIQYRWELKAVIGFNPALWARNRISVWYPFAFVGNTLAWLTIAAIISGIWEWRRRRVKHLWQFTLADGLLASLLVALFYGVERQLYRDMIAERELQPAFLNPYQHDEGNSLLGASAHLFSPTQDVPADWFWEILRMPKSDRPYRRLDLHLVRAYDNGGELTLRQAQLVGTLKDVTRFHCESTIDDECIAEIAKLPNLNRLELMWSRITDRGIRTIMDYTHLKHLTLRSNSRELTDASLDLFAERKQPPSLELIVSRSSVSDAAVNRLKAAIPGTSVEFK